MNIQITGTHKADEVPGSLAGSKRNSAKRRTSQSNSAKEDGILSVRPKQDGDRMFVARPDKLLLRAA
jgi:hypothetical protein